MPISKKELNKSLYQIKKDVTKPVVEDGIIYYTLLNNKQDSHQGYPIRYKQDELCYAYEETKRGVTKFYVLRNMAGDIFNPIATLTSEQRFLEKQRGRKTWDFKPINKHAFIFYINFLKTRNTVWFTHAQRGVN